MSNGPFANTRYSTDNADIVPIRVQPETITAVIDGVANTAPTGSLSPGFPSAEVSGARRKLGIRARLVRLRVTAAGGGLSVGSVTTIPWLTQAGFNGISRGQTGTYNGASVAVLGKTPERIN